MKYSNHQSTRQRCPHDPDYRAQLGFRLRSARCALGWSIEAAAKYFQVTQRTWHNWESGAHRIPFAVYKLCRVLSRLELPGDGWAGWTFQGSALITPEGRRIEPKDSSWWSLMVRNAQSFSAAYNEARRLRLLIARSGADATTRTGGEADSAGGASGAGLVSSKTSGNLQQVTQHQSDVIMQSWPIHSDFQTPLTPLHAPKRNTSASPLTPSFVSPWMPICGVRLSLPRPKPGPHLTGLNHQKQVSSLNRQSLQSSPEPKRSDSMTSATASFAGDSSSARPAAAGAAKLASASGGQS